MTSEEASSNHDDGRLLKPSLDFENWMQLDTKYMCKLKQLKRPIDAGKEALTGNVEGRVARMGNTLPYISSYCRSECNNQDNNIEE